MPRTTTLTDAFAFFDCVPRNPRWAWSAVSPDGKTVALTVWEDELGPDGSYDCFGRASRAEWMNRIGNRDRARNLQHAIHHCDGKVRVVRVTAADTKAGTRVIKDRRADPDAWMKIVRLDRDTGEFRAELI